MKKKEVPLTVVRSLKTLKDNIKSKLKNHDFIKVEAEDWWSIRIVDTDNDSDFYFEVFDFNFNKNSATILAEFKPENDKSLDVKNIEHDTKNILAYFDYWLKIIEEYNNTILSPDEKILKAYEEEFFTEFEIIDDDAEEAPFNLSQQLYLDKYLQAIEESLSEYSSDESIKPILKETKALRENITNETKKSAIKKFSKILSKIRKNGLKLLKEVYTEAKKELIKRIVEGSLDGIDNMLPPI